MQADLVGCLPAEVEVRADTCDTGQHGTAKSDLGGLVNGERKERRGVFLEGLHSDCAENRVVPVSLNVAYPRERDIGQEIALRTEVSAHAVGEGVLVVGVMHGEEVGA